MLDKNKTGLALGTFSGALHAIWSLLVAVIPGQLQGYLDWVTGLHSLKPIFMINPFNLSNAIMLVIMAFVMGYVIGFVFAYVWNWANKK